MNENFEAFCALGFNRHDATAMFHELPFLVDYFSDLLREEFYPTLPAPNTTEEK